MRDVFTSLLSGLLLLVNVAEADGPEGARLLRACGAAVKQQDGLKISDEELADSLWCIGYVMGFLDALAVSNSTASARQLVCLPRQGITNDQAVRIVVKYLRENPGVLHESSRASVFIALAKAFPCR
jgi:hypothetical protein